MVGGRDAETNTARHQREMRAAANASLLRASAQRLSYPEERVSKDEGPLTTIANRCRMKNFVSAAAIIWFAMLAGCSGVTPSQELVPPSGSSVLNRGVSQLQHPAALTELFNLDYSNGSITVFSLQGGRAKETVRFKPGHGHAQGLASDTVGNIYTTITSTSSKPCAACVQIFTDTGKLVTQLDSPILKGAPGAPSLTDVSVDRHDNVYVSDYGQQAVYYFWHAKMTKRGPTIVVQNSSNAASVLSTPDGSNVMVSGGCGFASVRPYTRISRGQYSSGSCFGIGTIALLGGAVDNAEDVMTPVDGVFGLVSVSSPSGGTTFQTPDRLASISGVAFNRDASIAYVANHHKECVYAFARPSGGWINGGQPKLLAAYKGFKALDIIAVLQ